MAYRNKTYICFDGDTDIHYYWLMTAWKDNDDHDFNFQNAHDLNTARDSSQEESIRRQLRERFANSKLLVVLIGEKTKLLTKFVKWEMEAALRLELPIIGVNLNGARCKDARCPPTIDDALAIFVPFNQKIIAYAMDNWPASDEGYRREGKSGSYHYKDHVYEQLSVKA
jgi:MTH538 TIR-like domain (DUF1863)